MPHMLSRYIGAGSFATFQGCAVLLYLTALVQFLRERIKRIYIPMPKDIVVKIQHRD
jgi:hypothetical protein